MITNRNKTGLTLKVRLLDNSGTPITGVLFSDGSLSVSYRGEEDATWTSVTLVDMTLGTFTDSGWIESPDADGFYDFGVPDASVAEGERVKWKFEYGANDAQYGDIDYIDLETGDIVFPTEADINFTFAIPGATTIVSDNPTLYIKEKSIVVTFTADTDITSIPLVVIFENADQSDVLVVPDGSLTKVSNEVTLTLPDSFTDDTTSLNWAIRHETSLRVYGTGTVSVTYAPHEDA